MNLMSETEKKMKTPPVGPYDVARTKHTVRCSPSRAVSLRTIRLYGPMSQLVVAAFAAFFKSPLPGEPKAPVSQLQTLV